MTDGVDAVVMERIRNIREPKEAHKQLPKNHRAKRKRKRKRARDARRGKRK